MIDVQIGGEITPEGMLNFSTNVLGFIVRLTESYPNPNSPEIDDVDYVEEARGKTSTSYKAMA
eukprot:CAMPEP_0171313968 /NCGR_PEP_ID=MMETSP0816-20121228/47432_1 /TAXON_ID=420281 /ORGANISM="Proboscia inermis, Strain CCAP1064/1" /LENGTH=62 /DNA_ID=CAMNT_0011802197 /DNA_START=410 /DNA_END=598 /DNA_ORIENTATION=+